MAGSAGLALGSALVGSTVAQTDDGTDGEDGSGDDEDDGMDEPVENEFEDDVAILNFARTLEFLEARFYARGLDNIGEEDLCSCKAFGDGEDNPLRDRAFDELRTIQAHEEAHVEALGAAVEELGGEPVEEPDFDFGLAVEYPMAFLATAAQLENVGVSAYAGAAPHIESEEIVVPALGIHSVEARHASFLGTLNGRTGFPAAVDEPRTRSEVEALIAPFVVGMEEPDEEEPDDEEPGDGEGSDDQEPDDEPPDNGTDTPNGDDGTDVPENATDAPDNGTDVPENGTNVST